MKFKDIIAGAASIAGTLNPALGAAIKAVNYLLPEDKKLPETATGNDVANAVDALPPEQKASLMESEIDLEKVRLEQQASVYIALSKADNQETRAKIVLENSRVLCFVIVAFAVWLFVNPAIASSGAIWTAFAILTGAPATVLMNYFGNLRKEHAQRQITAGADPKGITGLGALAKLIPWGK